MRKAKATLEMEELEQHKRLLGEFSAFSVRESYRTLRANIRFSLQGDGCKTFCITSSAQGEGKTITITNLAISFAEAGQRVLLIDADLRRPAVARLLMENGTPGLSNVLAGIVSEEEAIRSSAYEGLDVLFAGDIPPNPAELLGSPRMAQLIEKLSKRYDYILVDTPPVNVVSDTGIVANVLNGVLVLARQDKSRKDNLKRAMDSLKLAGANVIGCVLNGVPRESKTTYGYYNHNHE